MIYALLKDIARERTVIVVTHAEALAQMADRIVHMSDGKLVTAEHPAEPSRNAAEQRRRTDDA
jgi:ABC-type lipoprotein export system ATPase subunit